jgi:hypothetical protein
MYVPVGTGIHVYIRTYRYTYIYTLLVARWRVGWPHALTNGQRWTGHCPCQVSRVRRRKLGGGGGRGGGLSHPPILQSYTALGQGPPQVAPGWRGPLDGIARLKSSRRLAARRAAAACCIGQESHRRRVCVSHRRRAHASTQDTFAHLHLDTQTPRAESARMPPLTLALTDAFVASSQ